MGLSPASLSIATDFMTAAEGGWLVRDGVVCMHEFLASGLMPAARCWGERETLGLEPGLQVMSDVWVLMVWYHDIIDDLLVLEILLGDKLMIKLTFFLQKMLIFYIKYFFSDFIFLSII